MTMLSSLLSPIYGAELEVGTVDGMQGREKEAVVISLVRSNEKVNNARMHNWALFTDMARIA